MTKVHTAVVGDPTRFATNAGASKSAKRAIRRAVEARRRELAINDAAENAAMDWLCFNRGLGFRML